MLPAMRNLIQQQAEAPSILLGQETLTMNPEPKGEVRLQGPGLRAICCDRVTYYCPRIASERPGQRQTGLTNRDLPVCFVE